MDNQEWRDQMRLALEGFTALLDALPQDEPKTGEVVDFEPYRLAKTAREARPEEVSPADVLRMALMHAEAQESDVDGVVAVLVAPGGVRVMLGGVGLAEADLALDRAKLILLSQPLPSPPPKGVSA